MKLPWRYIHLSGPSSNNWSVQENLALTCVRAFGKFHFFIGSNTVLIYNMYFKYDTQVIRLETQDGYQ